MDPPSGGGDAEREPGGRPGLARARETGQFRPSRPAGKRALVPRSSDTDPRSGHRGQPYHAANALC